MAPESAEPPPRAQVRELIRKHHAQGWDEAWKISVTPWDAGQPQPPLMDLIESGILEIARGGTALVPGCGRGYDAICIADRLGLETLGTDISPTAVEAAREYLSTTSPTSSVRYEVADFFTLEGSFDLVGTDFSSQFRPSGGLVTLIFPIDPYTETGPPFYVRPEHYEEVLGEGWEKVLGKVPENSLETHVNRERIVVRKKM